MELFDKVVLQFETKDGLLESELQSMYSLLNTAVTVSHYKPEIKKMLEDDPEGFCEQLIEEYIAHKIDDASDKTRTFMERHEELTEHIEDLGLGMPFGGELMGGGSFYQDEFEHYVDVLHAAREIVIDFFLHDINDKKDEDYGL